MNGYTVPVHSDWPHPEEILIDYPDPAPGFPEAPRPGSGFRLAAPYLAAIIIVAGVAGMITLAKMDLPVPSVVCLVIAILTGIWLPSTVRALKVAHAWREGRIVPARVLNPLFKGTDEPGIIAATRVLTRHPAEGMMERALDMGTDAVPARVEYVANGCMHIAEVVATSDASNWQVNQVVWVILHAYVVSLTGSAPRKYRSPVPDNLRQSLLKSVNQLPRA